MSAWKGSFPSHKQLLPTKKEEPTSTAMKLLVGSSAFG